MELTRGINLVSMRQFYAMHVRLLITIWMIMLTGFNASILRDACKIQCLIESHYDGGFNASILRDACKYICYNNKCP